VLVGAALCAAAAALVVHFLATQWLTRSGRASISVLEARNHLHMLQHGVDSWGGASCGWDEFHRRAREMPSLL